MITSYAFERDVRLNCYDLFNSFEVKKRFEMMTAHFDKDIRALMNYNTSRDKLKLTIKKLSKDIDNKRMDMNAYRRAQVGHETV